MAMNKIRDAVMCVEYFISMVGNTALKFPTHTRTLADCQLYINFRILYVFYNFIIFIEFTYLWLMLSCVYTGLRLCNLHSCSSEGRLLLKKQHCQGFPWHASGAQRGAEYNSLWRRLLDYWLPSGMKSVCQSAAFVVWKIVCTGSRTLGCVPFKLLFRTGVRRDGIFKKTEVNKSEVGRIRLIVVRLTVVA